VHFLLLRLCGVVESSSSPRLPRPIYPENMSAQIPIAGTIPALQQVCHVVAIESSVTSTVFRRETASSVVGLIESTKAWFFDASCIEERRRITNPGSSWMSLRVTHITPSPGLVSFVAQNRKSN
jgi:hypothetical protein